jgi:hypothetical protein
MLKVYGDLTSGNCYKVKLLMALLAIDHQWVPVSALAGETRDPAFLAKNPARDPRSGVSGQEPGRENPTPGDRAGSLSA